MANLAARSRPTKFAEIQGQEHVSDPIREQIKNNKVASAYLFCGPRGTGKTTTARVLAMALNCENKGASGDGEPCGSCTTCSRISSGSSSLDVVEIDGASNRGIDDAKELRERAMYAPSGAGHYKVYIIDECHMLTTEAWNALLKTLEEPPPGVVFVFATTEPQKIIQRASPVLSRVQRYDLHLLSATQIYTLLNEAAVENGIEIEPGALRVISSAANGSPRDGLTRLDQLDTGCGAITEAVTRQRLGLPPERALVGAAEIMLTGATDRIPKLFDYLESSYPGGNIPQFFQGALSAVQLVGRVKLGAVPDGIAGEHLATLQRIAGEVEIADVQDVLRLATKAEGDMQHSAMPALALEGVLLDCAALTGPRRDARLREAQARAGQSPVAGTQPATAAIPPSSRAVPESVGAPAQQSTSSRGAR